jgi:hypothetical protein
MKNNLIFAFAMAATALPVGAFAQETPSTSATSPDAAAAAAAPADQTPAPKVGDTIYDNTGEGIGPVESVSGSQFVMSSTQGRATLPVASLAAGNKGLTINMTKAQFEAAVAAAHGSAAAH